MRRPKLSTALVVTGAVAVGALAVPGSAIATQITSVFVTNDSAHPVPVTGSVAVNNLPTTQQVDGTVDIGNLPATQHVDGTVGIDSSANTVRIDRGQTVPVTSSDDAYRQAYARTFNFNISEGSTNFWADASVPTGSRLVVTSVSGAIYMPAGAHPTSVFLRDTTGSSTQWKFHYFVPQSVGHDDWTDRDVFAVSTETMIPVTSEFGQFEVGVFKSAPAGTAQVQLTVAGYLIDCSASGSCN